MIMHEPCITVGHPAQKCGDDFRDWSGQPELVAVEAEVAALMAGNPLGFSEHDAYVVGWDIAGRMPVVPGMDWRVNARPIRR